MRRIVEENREKYENLERKFSTYDWIRYDLCGNPISYALWHLLKEIEEYFLIAQDLQDGYSILTFWIGMPDEMFRTEIRNDLVNHDKVIVLAVTADSYEEAYHQHEGAGFMIDQKMLSIFFNQEQA